ncbi:MAG: type I toxin-antitoxin system Fst family toxin [Streptococcus vestibularis]|nr:type I toxin-antitoxin system Fst family toxin [Streptococcus vestibularis]
MPWHLDTAYEGKWDLLFKIIIGPIVVDIILRLIDKWLNKDR